MRELTIRTLRISDAEAEAWLQELMEHIRNRHKHLYNQDATGLAVRGTLKHLHHTTPPDEHPQAPLPGGR